MIKIASIVMNVEDVEEAARFWADALGYEVRHVRSDWSQVGPRDGEGPNLSFDLRDRMHLDLVAARTEDREAEVERLIALGATVVEDWPYPPGADFTVLADPSGNLFCVTEGESS